MKNSLRIHKWTHNEFNIFILGVLTHPLFCYIYPQNIALFMRYTLCYTLCKSALHILRACGTRNIGCIRRGDAAAPQV